MKLKPLYALAFKGVCLIPWLSVFGFIFIYYPAVALISLALCTFAVFPLFTVIVNVEHLCF